MARDPLRKCIRARLDVQELARTIESERSKPNGPATRGTGCARPRSRETAAILARTGR
jgi:hypothetical protein